MSETSDLVMAVQGLQATADSLREWSEDQSKVLRRIENLAVGQETLAKYGRRNRIGLQVGVIGVTLALLVGGFAVVQSVKLQRLYNQVQDVQTRTSTEVLCPLYQLFALSINVNPVPPNYTAEQTKLRQQFADAMNTGLVKLGCPKQS